MAARQIMNVAKSGVLQKLAVAESALVANKVSLCGYYGSGPSGYGSPSGYSGSGSPSGYFGSGRNLAGSQPYGSQAYGSQGYGSPAYGSQGYGSPAYGGQYGEGYGSY